MSDDSQVVCFLPSIPVGHQYTHHEEKWGTTQSPPLLGTLLSGLVPELERVRAAVSPTSFHNCLFLFLLLARHQLIQCIQASSSLSSVTAAATFPPALLRSIGKQRHRKRRVGGSNGSSIWGLEVRELNGYLYWRHDFAHAYSAFSLPRSLFPLFPFLFGEGRTCWIIL